MPDAKIVAPEAGKALVRMYRQGLGDCFLLTFRGDDGQPVHILIDCGVWDGDAATLKQMEKVVASIRAATDDHLHVLVVTHEHWDHNSGFRQHKAAFEKMTIDLVWLAWTENLKGDSLAKDLHDEYEARRNKLKMALDGIARSDKALAGAIDALAGFSAAARADPAGAMQWVRDLPENGHTEVEFLKPGRVVDIPGAKAAGRAFVLGPPRSRSMLVKNRPTKKLEDEGQVYHLAGADPYHLRYANRAADDAFLVAAAHSGKKRQQLLAMTGDDREAYELNLPFDLVHQLDEADHPLFSGTYAAEKWRRIDRDWLDSASQIALWMDSSTNNTSLVLAFELLPSRKVLLFVADAQVGNWLSWPSVKFTGPDKNVKVEHLLERTVLYKVGHHGSHNATLRKDGVEKMTSGDLIAMIPVNRRSVEKKKWKMPFAPMYRALRKACKGRVIRADEGTMPKPAATSDAVWKRFQASVTEDPVYIDCVIG